MKRTLAGTLLIGHGLAHALAGIRGTDPTFTTSGTTLAAAALLWALAAAGFAAAGLGLWGAPAFRAHTRLACWLGVGGSAALLILFWHQPWSVPGLAFDAAVVAALHRTRGKRVEVTPPARESHRRRALRRAGSAASLAFVAYLLVIVIARPWHVRWGSTAAELGAALPGDDAVAANYQLQHAVTIHAPPDEVWPWLAQLGHDQGGFYSYTWLENSFGLYMRNADRVHPEWQAISAGDSVFATPRDYLGTGRRFGWRVGRAEANRVLVLETWGAFVLQPMDSATTRLIVRTRGAGRDNLAAVLLSPFGLLVFEPAHFIMQRKMLLTIRDRVHSARQPGTGG